MKFNFKAHCVYLAAIVFVGAIGFGLYDQGTTVNQISDIALANIDALMQSENDSEKGNIDPEKGILDTSYTRRTKNCEFYVGANAKVTVLGLGVIKAGADGIISVPEQVTCIAGGNETCRPVECIDILSLIINTEKS